MSNHETTNQDPDRAGTAALEDPEEIEILFGRAFLRLREHEGIRFYQDRVEQILTRPVRAHGETLSRLVFKPARGNRVLERMMAHNNQATQAFVAISEFARVPLSTVREELEPDDCSVAMEIAGAFLTPGRRTGLK